MKTYKYTINGTQYEVAIGDIAENIATVTVNGEEFKVEMEPEAEPEKKKVVVKTGAASEPKQSAPAESGAAVNTANALKAPLPVVIVLEAMKMANNLESEKDGKVTAILVSQGASVMEDTPLIVIE